MKEKKRIFREANNHVGFWTMWLTMFTAFLAAGTVIAVVLGLMQLKTISETSRADFILKFKDSFFKKDARELMDEIDKDSLIYFISNDSISHFKYRKNDSTIIISAYDVEEILLDHFDNLGLFEKKGIISLDMVYDMFDWYIQECWENKEIQKYIKHEREFYNDDTYRNFEELYHKCRAIFAKNNDTVIVNKKVSQ